jgi:hypothetical protein
MALFPLSGLLRGLSSGTYEKYASAQTLVQLCSESKTLISEPRKRAHSPQLDFDELTQVAAGLASVSENGKLPYGRRFPVPASGNCRDLQLETDACGH